MARMRVPTLRGETLHLYAQFIPSPALPPPLFTAPVSSAGDSESLFSPGGFSGLPPSCCPSGVGLSSTTPQRPLEGQVGPEGQVRAHQPFQKTHIALIDHIQGIFRRNDKYTSITVCKIPRNTSIE